MTDDNIHPDSGADEDAKIWADLDKADAAKAAAEAAPEPDPAPVADPPAADPGADAPDTPPADKAAGDKPAGTAAAAPAATPDIWANATPEQRAAYEEATRRLNETNDQYRRVSGTVSALQRKINVLEKPATAPKGAEPKAADRPGAKPKDDAKPTKPTSILDDPELAKAEREYPEVIGPLKQGFKTLEERSEAMQRKLDKMDEDHLDRHIEEQIGYVVSQHPDYKQVKKAPEFKAWLQQAPAFVHDGVARNAQVIVDGPEVATIVELFKMQTGFGRPAANPSPSPTPAPGTQKPAISDKRKAQLESAAAPRGRGPSMVHNGPPGDDAPPEEHWAYYERKDQEKARR